MRLIYRVKLADGGSRITFDGLSGNSKNCRSLVPCLAGGRPLENVHLTVGQFDLEGPVSTANPATRIARRKIDHPLRPVQQHHMHLCSVAQKPADKIQL